MAFQITRANAYKDFAISQVKWMPAIAPFRQSYLVGYLNGPTAPHHRNDVAMGNVTRLKGGIVSGPASEGAFIQSGILGRILERGNPALLTL